MTKNKKPLELNNFSLIRSFSSTRFQDSGEGIVREKKDDFEKKPIFLIRWDKFAEFLDFVSSTNGGS